MAATFARISCWLWSGKDKESSPISPCSDMGFGLREVENSLKFPLAKSPRFLSSPRNVKKKWTSREERRIDREYDVVLVPSDGVCLSDFESDGSDWSIGWMEPHAHDFESDGEDSSFAVLVPCYRNVGEEIVESRDNERSIAIHNFTTDYYGADEKKYMMDQWLSSLQSS